VTDVELPADVAWSCPGSVVADERVEAGRRHLRLGLRRNQEHTIEMRREVKGGESERVLVQTVVVTILKLKPDGPSRHDVVLYEVSRGKLAEHQVELPPGLVVERIGTDEGDVPPITDGNRLVVQRNTRLSANGYLVVQFRAEPYQGSFALAPVMPTVDARARYLALSSNVAAEATPEPDTSWSRVDINDLPEMVRESAGGLDLVAAWRWHGDDGAAQVAINRLPPSEQLAGLIRRRQTTTVLTVEGTLLHHDRLTVSKGDSALELAFAEGTTVWSTEVNGLAVRPLERNGMTVLPLPFGVAKDTLVEVVSVQQRAIPRGRSQLVLAAPEVVKPVLSHQWRILLPEDNRYQYAGGDLRQSRYAPHVAVAQGADYDQGAIAPGSTYGGIYGRATTTDDQSLPGVTVLLTGLSLQGSKAVVTDERGRYRFTGLPHGTYQANFSLPGFNRYNFTDIRVAPGQQVKLDTAMELSSVVEEVMVVAEVPVVTPDEEMPQERDLQRRLELQQQPQQEITSQELQSLRQGLVGGVKPVPVTIPESGKTLVMEGVLPPSQVTVSIEVKAGR
jgi:hypothetical protein